MLWPMGREIGNRHTPHPLHGRVSFPPAQLSSNAKAKEINESCAPGTSETGLTLGKNSGTVQGNVLTGPKGMF